MEEADILRVALLELGQEDGVRVHLGVVEILRVARQTTQEDTLILLVPVVDREHDEALVDTPGVGQRGDERRVDHIPVLAVVLLLLVHNRVEGCATLADRE